MKKFLWGLAALTCVVVGVLAPVIWVTVWELVSPSLSSAQSEALIFSFILISTSQIGVCGFLAVVALTELLE